MKNYTNKTERNFHIKMDIINLLLGLQAFGMFAGGVALGYHLLPQTGIFFGLVLGVAALFLAEVISTAVDRKLGYYRCEECGHVHTLSFKALYKALPREEGMVMGCPQCREKALHTKVAKKPETETV